MKNKIYNVLVVDDEQAICDVIVDALPKRKYKVDVACDGQQGLEMARSKEYDVVFMDLYMPVLDGCEAIKMIKSVYPGVIVIIMTAAANREMVEKALKYGANSVMVKPFRISEVQSILKMLAPQSV
ncbi:MAG: response regulator [Candidatus Coatesbacteria bacterium]|nr:response regulator [Candidatus Coatesbacteria bacterium]